MNIGEMWANPKVKAAVFIVAIALLIGAHKFSLEAEIG